MEGWPGHYIWGGQGGGVWAIMAMAYLPPTPGQGQEHSKGNVELKAKEIDFFVCDLK